MVQFANRFAVRYELLFVICTWLDRQADFELIFWRCILEVKVPLNLGSSRKIGVERIDFRLGSVARSLNMKIDQQFVGSERADEKTLLALAVVNHLAADGAMHALRRFTEIVELHRRPVFAEAVRDYSVGGGRATEIQQRVAHSIDCARGFKLERFFRVILDL